MLLQRPLDVQIDISVMDGVILLLSFCVLTIMLIFDTHRLGLAISDEAIEQMKAHVVITDEDLEIARKEEAKRRHDVMGHVQYVHLHS
jgi:hypothetical protein